MKSTVILALLAIAVSANADPARKSANRLTSEVPKTWDEQAIASLEVPLAFAAASPKHVSADYYYRIPVRPIYKSYPVYHPGKEPSGYFENLKQRPPVVVWDDKDKRPRGPEKLLT